MIRLEVLGKPIVKTQNREAKLYSKAVALLAYLALEGRTNRRKIAEMLWAGAPDPLNNLSVTRGHILGELGEGALEADLESMALGADVWCDAIEWQQDPSQKSWGLYRGEFLQDLRLREWKRGLGEEFEEWVEEKRADFALERYQTAQALAKDALRSEKYLDAQKWLENLADDTLEPQEEAVRWLICLYGFQNQSDKAVALYSKLDKNLKESLGVCPTSQTEAAFILARDGQSASCLDLLKKELGSGFKQSQNEPLIPKTPFVGRSHILSELLNFLLAKPNNLARAVGLLGEPGSGKSRLAYELAKQLENRSKTALYFVKANPESPIAEPLAELCRALLQQRPQAMNQLSMASQKAIQRLLPDLFPKLVHEEDPNHNHHLKNALQHFFTAQKTIIVFDDLQWADTITIQHLKYMLEATHNGLHLIFTQRNTEPSLTDLDSILEWGAKQQSLEVQILQPLEPNDLGKLLKDFEDTHWDAVALKNASGGNPLYALELIRSKETNNNKVLSLIRQRIKHLGTLEQQTLEGFAILGGRSDLYTLGIVTGRSATELIETTELLEREGLLGNDQHKLYLNHDLTREAVLQDLGLARRSTLHLRAARSQHKVPENAANHYWESRNAWTPKDYRLAHQAFKCLSERNALHGEFVIAMQWLTKYEATAENHKQQVLALIEQVTCLVQYDKALEGFEILKKAKKVAQKLNSLEINAKILVIEARILIRMQNKLDDAKILLDTALNLLNSSNLEKLKINVFTMLGFYYQSKNNLIQSLHYYNLGLTIAKKLSDQSKIEEGLNNIASTYYLQNNYKEAKEIWNQLLHIRQLNQNLIGITSTLNNLTACSWQENNLKAALFYSKRAIQFFKKTNNSFELAIAYENKSCIFTTEKKFIESYGLLKKAMSIRIKNKFGVFDENFCYNMAEILFELESYKKFEIYMRKFWKILHKNQKMHSESRVMGLLLESQLKIKQKKFNHARKKLQEAESIAVLLKLNHFIEESRNRLQSIEVYRS